MVLCRNSLLRFLTCLALTAALSSVTFGHRGFVQDEPSELTAFVTLGGTLADICGAPGEDLTGQCTACLIVTGMALAKSNESFRPVSTGSLIAPLEPTLTLPATQSARLPPVRAPPRV